MQVPHSTGLDAIFTDSEAIRVWLSKLSTLAVYPIEAFAKSKYQRAAVICTQAEAAFAYGDANAWSEYWQKMDPLVQQCRGEIILYPDDGVAYRCLPTHRLRVWRSRKQMPALLR